MKRTDPKFLETFIVLHNNGHEIIIRKDCVIAISTGTDYNGEEKTFVDYGTDDGYFVNESIDEVLELL